MRGEKVPVIFGLKLRQLREEKGYGVKEFAGLAGLSASYLTEIEQGKKYPKIEKIMLLAHALETSYDDLVSLKLGRKLHSLAAFLESPLVEASPLKMFGLAPRDIIDLVAKAPQEAGAFIRTMVDVASSYDMHVEHFFHAMLRSYQETHDNYFDDIEQAAAGYSQEQGFDGARPVPVDTLREALERDFGVDVDEERLGRETVLSGFRSIWVAGPPERLLVNPHLSERQKAFQFAREIGYRILGLQERGMASSRADAGSFEQVLNDFKASYFAGALLMNQERMVTELEGFFARERWEGAAFLEMMVHFGVTPEMFLYRLTQIIPKRFGLTDFHFLRINYDAESGKFQLNKQFNMSRLLLPVGLGWHEHYCRRWLAVELLNQLASQIAAGRDDSPLIAAQRSTLMKTGDKTFVITLARPLALTPGTYTSVTLGFQLTPKFEKMARFWDDPAVPHMEIAETCERCGLADSECDRRAAPPVLNAQAAALTARREALAALAEEGKGNA